MIEITFVKDNDEKFWKELNEFVSEYAIKNKTGVVMVRTTKKEAGK